MKSLFAEFTGDKLNFGGFGDPSSDPFATAPDGNREGAAQPQAGGKREHKKYFSFSVCDRILKNKDLDYYCLFYNQGMDLEYLKSSRENAGFFIASLAACFRVRNVKSIVIAPRGDRYLKNGFHFATELISGAIKYSGLEIQIFEPFVKNRQSNRIVYTGAPVPPGAVIFDDILTFGTTIHRMAENVQGYKEIIILLCNGRKGFYDTGRCRFPVCL
jgi:hypothetical protein